MGCCNSKSQVNPQTGKRPHQKWIFADGVEGSEDVREDLESYYSLGFQLGQPGQFGVAYECTCLDDQKEYAVKVIEKSRFFGEVGDISDNDRRLYYEQFRDEIKMMKAMDHPNIIKLVDVFEDSGSLYLVMEKCDGGELFDRIKDKQKYSEKDAAQVLQAFAKGIEAMHEKKVAHCDLKPDNILFLTMAEDSPLKIIDFGMSKHSPNGNCISGFRGTPYYVAPEIVRREQYTFHCDMWSFGVIAFVMLFGFPPFHSQSSDDEEIYDSIKSGFCAESKQGFGAWFPDSVEVSDSAKDIISRCLEMDPVKRYTATEVLEHPWVTGETASSSALSESVLNGLSGFTSTCKLKSAVLGVMTELLSDVEITHLQKTFNAIDMDGDGHITALELKLALGKQVEDEKSGSSNSETKIDMEKFRDIIKIADADGDGQLSYNELLATCVQRKMKLKTERMLQAFHKFDADGSGEITVEEVKAMMKQVNNGKDITHEEAEAIIAEVDTNKDGVICETEFLAMWNKSQEGYKSLVLGDGDN